LVCVCVYFSTAVVQSVVPVSTSAQADWLTGWLAVLLRSFGFGGQLVLAVREFSNLRLVSRHAPLITIHPSIHPRPPSHRSTHHPRTTHTHTHTHKQASKAQTTNTTPSAVAKAANSPSSASQYRHPTSVLVAAKHPENNNVCIWRLHAPGNMRHEWQQVLGGHR
jgi:ABC-type nickel/cobalt efflux system permease component RcnA